LHKAYLGPSSGVNKYYLRLTAEIKYLGTNSLTQSFRPHYGPGVDSASNRNEYQVCFMGVKAAGA